MLRYLLPVLLTVITISCHDISSKHLLAIDSRSTWLLKNEDDANNELNKRIVIKSFDIPKNAVFKSATIVITKYDTTVLGEFAKLIDEYNPCILISYQFDGDTTHRKIITLFQDSLNCLGKTDTLFTIDSTKHFTIKIDSLLSGSH